MVHSETTLVATAAERWRLRQSYHRLATVATFANS